MNSELVKHPGGRPRKWGSVEELSALVDAYFERVEQADRPPTLAGLALALGAHKATIMRYIAADDEDEICDVLKKARLRVEGFHEERLAGPNCSGSIFWLKANAAYSDRMIVERERGPEIIIDDDDKRSIYEIPTKELLMIAAQGLTREELIAIAKREREGKEHQGCSINTVD